MRQIKEIIIHCSATREGADIPVETILSGPSASIMGILALCDVSKDSIALDIGGTTAATIHTLPPLHNYGMGGCRQVYLFDHEKGVISNRIRWDKY